MRAPGAEATRKQRTGPLVAAVSIQILLAEAEPLLCSFSSVE